MTEDLFRELYPVVRKQIAFLLGAGGPVDDAVQETMIAIHRGLPSFRGESSVKTWACRIAVRTARRLRDRERRQVPTDDIDLAVFDTDQAGAAELVLLRSALDVLTPKKREAFVMMGILELTAEEAGQALGTFANTAASRYRHACAELTKYLQSKPQRGGAP